MLFPLLVIGGVWLLRVPLLTAAGNMLVKEDQPTKADVLVVLGGDAFGTRIIKGAELAKAGSAPIVWVSGPVNLLGHDSDSSILFAKQHGFAESMFKAVWLTREADSTRGEAILIGQQLRAQGVHKILLVTSNYHTRRADYIWRTEEPWLQIAVVGAPDPYFTPNGWWKTRPGQKTFLLEFLKTIASHLGD